VYWSGDPYVGMWGHVVKILIVNVKTWDKQYRQIINWIVEICRILWIKIKIICEMLFHKCSYGSSHIFGTLLLFICSIHDFIFYSHVIFTFQKKLIYIYLTSFVLIFRYIIIFSHLCYIIELIDQNGVVFIWDITN
jgi:hypothetical protein